MDNSAIIKTKSEKPQAWRIGLVIVTGFLSTMFAQTICPVFIYIALFPHIFEHMDSLAASNSVMSIILFGIKWLANGVVTMPCYALGQICSIACLLEIIFIIVGVASKKLENKCKMTQSVMVVMSVKVIMAYVCVLGEFLMGMLFLIFPDLNNMVSYQHWPMVCTITSLVMLFGAFIMTGIHLLLKFSKK